MRIQIVADGVPTEQVRELAAALSQVGLRESLVVGCDGPELWTVATPKMQPWQHAQVFARLVRFCDRPIADTLNELRQGVS